ncbi:MAG TPA: TetR family transcriptional regulator C-terminal domain-containing protein [Candidatus Obscuribacterales bacterium]
MSPKATATKQDTKAALLQAGMDLMMEKGYTNTGINDVLNTLGIPKGSFYHHFDSKENYAVEIIRYFDAAAVEMLTRTLKNSNQTPLNRIRTFCEEKKAKLASQSCSRGCLVGNLSQEMSDQSEVLRLELSRVMTNWQNIVAECIKEGQKIKEIKGDRTAHQLAELFYSGWSGAVLRAKTLKSIEPIDTFIDLMLNDVLKA